MPVQAAAGSALVTRHPLHSMGTVHAVLGSAVVMQRQTHHTCVRSANNSAPAVFVMRPLCAGLVSWSTCWICDSFQLFASCPAAIDVFVCGPRQLLCILIQICTVLTAHPVSEQQLTEAELSAALQLCRSTLFTTVALYGVILMLLNMS